MDIARIDLAIADDADTLELVVGGRDTICRGLLSRSTQVNTKEEGNDKEARSLWDVLDVSHACALMRGVCVLQI